MPYKQSEYGNMSDYKYGGKMKGASKMHSGRYKYDKGYSCGGVSDPMYRGNDYNAIQDKIASKNYSKLASQSHNNY